MNIKEIYNLYIAYEDALNNCGTEKIQICFHSHYGIPAFSIFKALNSECKELEIDGVKFFVDNEIDKEEYEEIIEKILKLEV